MPKSTPAEIATLQARYAELYDVALATWPVATEAIEIPGRHGTTRVNACGPRDAPAVVLMPGGGATSTVYRHNVGDLARDHRVYAVDGFGTAGLSRFDGEKPRGIDDVVVWLDGVFDHLGVTEATLVGHSYNGWVCTNYALRRPDRVSHLVLLDPTGCLARTRLGYALHGIAPLLGRPNAVRRFIEWETDHRPIDGVCLDVMCAKRPGPDPFVWPRHLKAGAYQGFAVKTTVVVAGRSKMVTRAKTIRAAARRIPHARIVEIPEASHMMLPTEFPEEINAAIRGVEKVQA